MPRVAFQGERGAYGEIAALRYFSKSTLVPTKSFQEVFDAAGAGHVDYAIVPVENSIEGSVNEVYDLLLQTRGLRAIGEVYQRVQHCMIANNGTAMSDVRYCYSHPQALAQCRKYLQKKKIEPVAAYDTAGAVKLVKGKRLADSAAIASRRAAELYDMEILDEGIEDKRNNFTRFLVLAQQVPKPGNKRESKKTDHVEDHFKTSLIFSLKHVPGALFGILGEFSSRGINLTKIESRPTKETPWEYNFFMDIEGSLDDGHVRDALRAVRHRTTYFQVIGSYRRAEFG